MELKRKVFGSRMSGLEVGRERGGVYNIGGAVGQGKICV